MDKLAINQLAHETLRSKRIFLRIDAEMEACAAEIGADMIVLGARDTVGLKDVLMGSVLRKVTSHADCPVLIVRTHDEEIIKAA